MNAGSALVAIAAAAILCAAGCASHHNGKGPGQGATTRDPFPQPFTFSWFDRRPTPVNPGDSRIAEMFIGSYIYKVEYGAEPSGERVAPTLADRGLKWRQTSGFFYIWGHWLLFDTERTRTITWGTAAAARMIPADADDSEREQIIVRCGKLFIMPRTPTPPTFAPLLLEAGEDAEGNPVAMYVVVTTTGNEGNEGNETVTISEPAPVPMSENETDPDDIFEFYQRIIHNHPSCEE